MKAIVCYNYGSPDVLRCEEVEKPVPGGHEVLIEVRAASVNPLDGKLLKGVPCIFRLLFGLPEAKDARIGVDVAGRIEAVGKNVIQFKPGDKVFGTCIRHPRGSGVKAWISRGAFAEYVCAPESTLVTKPDNVTFEHAASAPVAAFTALQGLRDKGKIQPGQKVLVNGAAGGVGTFAVQIARLLGGEVTGVCSTRNVEMVRSIGADQVLDYTRDDFTASGKHYDLIFDCVGNHSLSACRRVLGPRGRYIMVGGQSGRGMVALFSSLAAAFVLSGFVGQKMIIFMAKPNQEDLMIMRELMATGKLRPVIDRCYGLNEVPEAIRYLERGHARGKVIITVGC
jgi:NADPH:quinone reductase-like Zn-dependent oxidoreductase